jgi:DNA-binding FadR family transcriptional regulator
MDAEALLKNAISAGRRQSLTELVIQALNAKIDRGDYLPGERLPTEIQLCAAFGVSRTVIREAVASLRLGRRLVARHGVGVFVALAAQQALAPHLLDTSHLHKSMHVLELRLGAEVEAAAYAAERRSPEKLAALEHACRHMASLQDADEAACARADFDFHLAIANSTGNPYFPSFLQSVAQEITLDLHLKHSQESARERQMQRKRIDREHQKIFDAIERQDRNAARLAMRHHLRESLAYYHLLVQAEDHADQAPASAART